jgi:zinc and cadmium transporter
MPWLWPVLAALLASTAALAGSALILALGRRAERAAVWLLAYAVGTLLGAAFLGLVPEALERAPPGRTMALLLAGILGFVALERALRWRRPHEHRAGEDHSPAVERVTATMILWGDALHNLVDGVVMGAAFAAGPAIGLSTALAVFAHEVPQEIGDFAILLGSGMERRRAVWLNWLSGLATVPGALAAWAWSSEVAGAAGWLLPIAAGGFTYIALADLVPALHARRGAGAALAQTALVLAGVGTIWALGRAAHGPG